jgi:integrase
MARSPSFNFRKTDKGWLVNLPGSVSDTGRFRRRYFKTRDAAKTECQRLREIKDRVRSMSVDISPALAEDALQARDLLAPFDVTLSQAAAFYAKHHNKRSKAPTISEAWEAAVTHRENHRPRTLADLKSWKKALPAWFMAMNAFDVSGKDITKALDETTKGQTRWKTGLRNISSVMGDIVKNGAIPENPTKTIQTKRNVESADDVSIYTPAELQSLFDACQDYPSGPDRLCANCAAPFALMAFAGVRPDEVTKLKWADVSPELGNIRIGPSIAKKARRRNVRINHTLAAWIATVPPEARLGKIVPPRWRYKAAMVRKMAGICGREKQDALRHSFGTYMLATENDMDALKSDMGHEHVRVFFNHYHKAVTKAQALPYWQVLPPGTEIAKMEVVA